MWIYIYNSCTEWAAGQPTVYNLLLSTHLQASRLGGEVHLPTAVLAGARGIVAMSLLKVGAGWSATYGTGEP
jgi:hypothetical protein